MEESNFFSTLRIFDDDFDEDLLKYPKYCLLTDKPFDNLRRINLFKYEDFINCMIHLQKHHPDRYFTDSARYNIDFTLSRKYHSIIRQMNYLYFVEIEVNNDIVSITVHILNNFNAHYQTCTVELKQEKILVKETPVKRYVMRSGIMRYIYSLEFNVSDLSIIGDITQTEVFVTLENYVLCLFCDSLEKYSNDKARSCSWQCLECSISTRDILECRLNQAIPRCGTRDCPEKLHKHTHFFCRYQQTCYVCHKKFYEPTYHVHYLADHQDITYQIGENIRIQVTPGRYCLLRYSTDTLLVMRYHLDSKELCLAIRSPWTRTNLDEYNCSITVCTHEQTESFHLYPLLYEYDDWKLSVGKWLFKKWNTDTEFTVVVNIIPKEENDVQIVDN